MRFRFAVAALSIGISLVSATRRRPVGPPILAPLDIHRSFAITDEAILDGFSFERVLTTLVERSGVRDLTALSLYQQWFDTQNPAPGLAVGRAPHCDDFLTEGKPSFNGFPRRCPTAEGKLAATDPFVPRQYIPIGRRDTV